MSEPRYSKTMLGLTLVALILAASSLGALFYTMNQLNSQISDLKETMDVLTDVVAPSGLERLLAAKEEGRLLIYTTWKEDVTYKWLEKFNEKYPFIQVEFVSSVTSTLWPRLVTEHDAGSKTADIFWSPAGPWWYNLRDEGITEPYNSTEYSAYDSKYVDPNGNWFTPAVIYQLLVYNSDLVTEAPTNWPDMLKPEYKSSVVIMDARNPGGSYWELYALWKLYGWSFWEQLIANEPYIYTSAATCAEAVGTGTAKIGWTNLDFALARIELGMPIEIVYPTDGINVFLSWVGIIEGGDNPNAARLFLDWMASMDGQIAQRDTVGLIPTRPGVSPPTGVVPLDQVPAVIPIDFDEFVSKETELRETITQMIG